MRRTSSRSSRHSEDLDGFVPDGVSRMGSLFESVTGTGSRAADETIRGPMHTTRLAATSTSSSTGTAHQRPLPPHMSSSRVDGGSAEVLDVPAVVSRSQQDFLDAKLQLEQAKLVSQTATLINSRWNENRRLAADGGNLVQWLHELAEVGEAHMSNCNFFIQPIENSTFEKIARMVVLSGVHSSLVIDLQRLGSTLEMLSHLKKKFSVISRAAQVNVWNRFLSFSVDSSDSTGLSSTMRNLYAEWNNLNVRIHSDAFFGFVFQRAVMRSSVPFKKDFEQRIENAMQNDATKSLPKFEALVNAFDICKKQHEHTLESENTSSDNPAPSVLLTSGPEDFDFNAFLADVPEENWPDALDFYAATAHRCWQCGAADHYLRECPQRAKPNQLNRRLRGPGVSPFQIPSQRTQATFVGSLYTHPQTQTGSGPAARAPPPSQFQVQAKRLADLYRPRYQSHSNRSSSTQAAAPTQSSSSGGGATAQMVEIGDVPDDLDDLNFRNMALGEDVLLPPTDLSSPGLETSTSKGKMAF